MPLGNREGEREPQARRPPRSCHPRFPRGRVRVFRALSTLALLLGLACQTPASIPGDRVDDAGTRLALPVPPGRIVSLIPATTELVFALGQGERLVGRTSWCDYPARAAEVPDLGNGIDPNVEAVLQADRPTVRRSSFWPGTVPPSRSGGAAS